MHRFALLAACFFVRVLDNTGAFRNSLLSLVPVIYHSFVRHRAGADKAWCEGSATCTDTKRQDAWRRDTRGVRRGERNVRSSEEFSRRRCDTAAADATGVIDRIGNIGRRHGRERRQCGAQRRCSNRSAHEQHRSAVHRRSRSHCADAEPPRNCRHTDADVESIT